MVATLNKWIKTPTKKQVILFTSFWLLGVLLLVLSVTDNFQASIIQKKILRFLC